MPDCEILIDKSFEGPSIIELLSIMGEIPEDHPVKVSWSNKRDEVAALRSFPKRKFILVVDDFSAKDRVIASLGLPLDPPAPVLKKAKDSLVDIKTGDWRGFCEDSKKGLNPKWLLLKLVADSLRLGKHPVLVEILPALLLDGGINQDDVDVLLRLKSRR